MKNLKFCLFLLSLIFLGNSWSATAQNDSDLIMSRIRAKLAPSGMSTVEDVVATYLPTIQTNGSWNDINYQDEIFEDAEGWEPKKHNDRLFAFAQAYVLDGSTYKGNSALFTAIENGLTYYFQVNPTCTHWWTIEIQAPQIILSTLIYLRDGASTISSTLETNIVNRFDALPEPTKHGIGANRSDMALWHLYQALLRDNTSELSYASEYLFNSFVTTTGNGIQHDYSYMDHGPQLYTYSYGTVLVNNTNRAAGYLVGTPYAMPDQYLQVYSNFLKTGYSTCLRGKYVSFSTLGRSISRPNQVRKYAGAFSEAITIDAANADFYQKVWDRSNGTVAIGHDVTPVNTNYYRSKFTTHNRDSFYFTVFTTSNKTEKTETGNGENLKAKFLSDGATNILVDGDEYFNIFPTWDWTKIPGTTVPEYSNLMPSGYWGVPGTSTFTGGVTNGAYGAHTFAMNDYNTRVKKAWFCFDEEVVCLGSGLTSSASETINTTINQCLLDGIVTVSENGNISQIPQDTENTLSNNPEWVLHDNVGYFFPQGGNLKLNSKTQTGSWYEINTIQSNDPVSNDVFKLWIDHGSQPQNANYAYIIAPGKTSVSDMQAYNTDSVVILSNTEEIQAVKHQTLDMIQVIFYRAGSLTTNGMTIQADRPCAMLLSNVSSTTVNVSISDPGQNSSVVNIGFESPQIPDLRQLSVSLPTNIEEAGKSVNEVIDFNTPVAPVNNDIIAVEDAYVRGGINANTNYPDGDLVCKTVADEAYVRSVFVKFDVSSLAGQNGYAKVKLNLASMGVNTFSAYYVDDDNWSETTLTWANMPATTTHLGDVTSDGTGIVEWDISSELISELSDNQIITIKIEALTDQVYSSFYSHDAVLPGIRPAIEFTPIVEKVFVQHDAFVRGGTYADNNFNWSFLATKSESNESYTRESFLKFDLSDFNSQTGKYTLKLSINSGDTDTWKIWFCDNDSWTESSLTWNNKPATTELIGTFTNTTSLLEVDITEWVLTELNGDQEISIKIESISDQVYTDFVSKENTDATKHPAITFTQMIDQVHAQHDAFVRGGSYGDTNYNWSVLVTKSSSDDTYTRESYLKFDLSDFYSATGTYTLDLSVLNGNTDTWDVWFSDDDNWTETTLTWNNKPATTDLIGTFTNTGSQLEIDISSWVISELAGDRQITIKIVSTTNNVYADIASRNNTDETKHPVIHFIENLKYGKVPATIKEVNDTNNSNISLYPNPVTEIFYLNNVPDGTPVSIYSLAGKLIKYNNYDSGIMVSDLPKGVYIIIVNIDGREKSLKMKKR